jgi:hypothetical protein
MVLPWSGQKSITTHRHTQNFFFSGGRTGPEAIHDLVLTLKAMLRESCPNLRADKNRVYRKNENSVYTMFSFTQNSLFY